MALKKDGTVWAWGNNTYGQLGDNLTTNRSAPVQVENTKDPVAIAAGWHHSLLVKADGSIRSWGAA